MSKETGASLSIPERLPLLETGDRVVFPFAVETLPLSLSGARPLLESSHQNGDLIALLPRSPEGRRGPAVGVVALLLRMGPGNTGEGLLVVQGVSRVRLQLERKRGAVRWAKVVPLHDLLPAEAKLAAAAMRRSLLERLDQLTGSSRGLPSDAREFLRAIEDPGRFADAAASQLSLPPAQAMKLLLEVEPMKRMNALLLHLSAELEISAIQEKLSRQTRDEMDRRQRDYFLRQQLEAIQAELGGDEGAEGGETSYRKRLKELSVPAVVSAPLEKEIAKLARFGPFSEEASQVRAYLDLVFDLPWGAVTQDRLDLKEAQATLDAGHYGLEKAKARILEHLAVSLLKGGMTGTVFCFVGPPGVGKTSLGRSIAQTLGRKFVRVSLGGVRDEAEVRGHRRTYIGAMPGRILQGIKNSGSRNPVFVLDEVDKMGNDWRGDPSAALLEALDAEQNREFVDHYLGFPFDLSQVMFIATANTLETVHPAFVDRCEVLELNGYTEEEKLAIARRHILPKALAACGLEGREVALPDATVTALIRRYTREAGVRNLERTLETVLRKLARKVAEGSTKALSVAPADLEKMLGPAPFFHEDRLREDRVGVVPGLAWTEVGGEILFVEAAVLPGNGVLTLTGQLGDVMKESIQAALTYLKEHAATFGLKPTAFSKQDIHVHVPQGSVPKDGPSAGITMATALLSALTGRPANHKTALTGEITLRGDILPVGGLREKLLAAHRARMTRVILPAANRHEAPDFPKSALKDLQILYISTIEEAFQAALGTVKKPRAKTAPPRGKETKKRRLR